ncbi:MULTISPECIES: hypothetical protein [unclassified Streptomyces]|uniref:hypothetical protein n=1 Tax=unclassified Streptomyces TaxID=2593676 RepID=UPI0002000E6C|nr:MULTISPECIES: hypothetical protein [unclassified Streptomyces]MYQ60078.1 hypothetical protein [Streptomyces sp. SID4926]SCD98300.1 hypothetical protein GA0115252_12628 [Streptomyces sp. DfronAA-171]
MQQKPIDTSRLGVIRCVIAPEPRTTPDGEVRRDREGTPQWITGLSVRQAQGRRTDIVHVTTSGQPQGITEGAPVRVVGFWASDWEVDGRSGVSYRAEGLEPAPGSSSTTQSAPASGSASSTPASGSRGSKGE